MYIVWVCSQIAIFLGEQIAMKFQTTIQLLSKGKLYSIKPIKIPIIEYYELPVSGIMSEA